MRAAKPTTCRPAPKSPSRTKGLAKPSSGEPSCAPARCGSSHRYTGSGFGAEADSVEARKAAGHFAYRLNLSARVDTDLGRRFRSGRREVLNLKWAESRRQNEGGRRVVGSGEGAL